MITVIIPALNGESPGKPLAILPSFMGKLLSLGSMWIIRTIVQKGKGSSLPGFNPYYRARFYSA